MSNTSRIDEDRVLNEAEFIIKNRSTVRETSAVFKISKSTVHRDMVKVLPTLDNKLYIKVREILDINSSEKHIRGGEATRRKYAIMNWEMI